ncbi:MAG: hypothetical protein HWD58_05810 [Bacteroidota bacterium]|nr:MAG: hypothetical protein HWD58_05810 [Bacteroidota bacterium]
MRRFLSILLLSIYNLFSTGLVVHAHYCQEELAALQLYQEARCCCDEEPTEPSAEDCCKDEIKTFKIADAQMKVEPRSWASDCAYALAILSAGVFVSRLPDRAACCTPVFICKFKRSPDITKSCPLYIRYQRLVLYC